MTWIFIIFNDVTGVMRACKDKFKELLDIYQDIIAHTWQGRDGNDELDEAV